MRVVDARLPGFWGIIVHVCFLYCTMSHLTKEMKNIYMFLLFLVMLELTVVGLAERATTENRADGFGGATSDKV
jgi:hypothetical protein